MSHWYLCIFTRCVVNVRKAWFSYNRKQSRTIAAQLCILKHTIKKLLAPYDGKRFERMNLRFFSSGLTSTGIPAFEKSFRKQRKQPIFVQFYEFRKNIEPIFSRRQIHYGRLITWFVSFTLTDLSEFSYTYVHITLESTYVVYFTKYYVYFIYCMHFTNYVESRTCYVHFTCYTCHLLRNFYIHTIRRYNVHTYNVFYAHFIYNT